MLSTQPRNEWSTLATFVIISVELFGSDGVFDTHGRDRQRIHRRKNQQKISTISNSSHLSLFSQS